MLPAGRRGDRTRARALEAAGLDPSVGVLPLYGELDAAAQDRRPAGGRGRAAQDRAGNEHRRDQSDHRGCARRRRCGSAPLCAVRSGHRHEPARDRQGVAGGCGSAARPGRPPRPGACYRLWSEGVQSTLAAQTPPEILHADLAPLALELACWGSAEAGQLRWLDPPPAAPLAQARDLLRLLCAIDPAGRVTPHGRALAAMGAHPRLAHMLIEGRDMRAPRLASEIAAILSERDPLRAAPGRATRICACGSAHCAGWRRPPA